MSCVLWTRHFQCALTDHYFRLIPGLDSFSKICKNIFCRKEKMTEKIPKKCVPGNWLNSFLQFWAKMILSVIFKQRILFVWICPIIMAGRISNVQLESFLQFGYVLNCKREYYRFCLFSFWKCGARGSQNGAEKREWVSSLLNDKMSILWICPTG